MGGDYALEFVFGREPAFGLYAKFRYALLAFEDTPSILFSGIRHLRYGHISMGKMSITSLNTSSINVRVESFPHTARRATLPIGPIHRMALLYSRDWGRQ